jgi:E3 ubiquitin-protein ligase listerin
MAKSKSSASSATRKKHARKAAAAAGQSDEPQTPKEKKPKDKKGSKRSKEPRKKVYIPPVKPAAVQPDPLDTLGIAQRIPADLHVVLRRLAKKDSVTKRRALEDFHADWVEKSRQDENLLAVLRVVLPVWVCSVSLVEYYIGPLIGPSQLHHVPALFLHPSRRVRQLAVNLHSALLAFPSLAKEIAFLLSEGTSSDHADFILGSWLLASCDIDRQASAAARESWNAYITTRSTSVTAASNGSSKVVLDPSTFESLWEFVQRILLDPSGVYLQVNPPQPILPPSGPQSRKGSGKNTPIPKRTEEPPSRSKAEEDEENEADRKARLRISGFGASEWILSSY